jgi:hypothetical protein
MENLGTWFATHPLMAVALGAFACGVALFYLVMRRTMKHRDASTQS